jgi:hypothetical protein
MVVKSRNRLIFRLKVKRGNLSSIFLPCAMRGLECAAAAAVLGFGVLLLMGCMATERMFAV